MSIANGDNCIGCQSCSKVCGKNCFTHSAKAA
jgi:NAD-dependent dihydropyrimidine dehydrogenase PreA subunit